MGVNHSGHPRSVNMENQTPIGIVEISEDVVKRLKLGLGKEAKKQAEATVTGSAPTTIQNQTAVSSQSAATTPSSLTPPPPPVIYLDQSMSMMEARRQKEQELQKIDAYWRNRLTQLEQNLNKTNKIMEDEYSAVVEDVKKRFSTSPLSPSNKLSSVQDLKIQLIACFRANCGEPLKCSEEVAAFINCVSENRVQKLDAGNDNSISSKTTPKSKTLSAAKAA